jgi:mono/diheme cytochrome c family protein
LIGSLKGVDLFRAYCAPCHGDDGKGNGPVAAALNAKPTDLTTIASRNGGVFPAQRISKIVAGDNLVMAHGSREMPIWGPIFHQVEWDKDLGNVRLQNVVKYVESIQKK